jgi:hypothetical protein
MPQCHYCQHQLSIARFECRRCGVGFEGQFGQPRLGRLPPDMQELAEQLLLAGGSLKEVAGWQNISYPTLRKRVDDLIASLQELRAGDEAATSRLLDEVEKGQLQPEQAARRIREMNHGT